MPLVYTNGIVLCQLWCKDGFRKQENQIHLSKIALTANAQACRLRSVSRLVNLWLKEPMGKLLPYSSHGLRSRRANGADGFSLLH